MMLKSVFGQTLRERLERRPFKPFLIEFDDGEQWVVGQPEAIHYHTGGSAVYFRPDGSFDFVDCDAVRQFLELAPVQST